MSKKWKFPQRLSVRRVIPKTRKAKSMLCLASSAEVRIWLAVNRPGGSLRDDEALYEDGVAAKFRLTKADVLRIEGRKA